VKESFTSFIVDKFQSEHLLTDYLTKTLNDNNSLFFSLPAFPHRYLHSNNIVVVPEAIGSLVKL
jgi:hypothetical protein